MLPPTLQKQESVLKFLSSKKLLGDRTGNNSPRMEEESPSSKPNTNKNQHEVGYNSCRSKCKSHFNKQHSSGSGGSCGPGLLAGNRSNIPTRNIVNRALEVMSNSLKNADYTPRQPIKSADDCDTEDESEKDQTPSDCSNSSDNDNDGSPEPASRLGNITAQLSFRKIAKKRRKAGGRSSFHHTKSSKEYIRKAQEAYQRLKISEQEQQNHRNHQAELESGREIGEKPVNQCKKDNSESKTEISIKSKDSDVIDYGYGDTSDTQTKNSVDYGYGDPVNSQTHQKFDYGYGDPSGGRPQFPRRVGRARRRNSVTKFSLEAANVVAAQAAAERILRLKPSLTSLSRSYPTTSTRRRQPQDQPQRLNSTPNQSLTSGRTGKLAAMQTTLQQPENRRNRKESIDNEKIVDRLEPPQRSSCYARGLCVNSGSNTKNLSREPEETESKLSKNDNSSSLQSRSSHSNPHFRLTSDYFSSDIKPKELNRKNSDTFSSTKFRFNTPARTSSWLSHDNSYSTVNKNDDDDADSLASDMESLCSIRDDTYRLDTHHSNHTLKKSDVPPVLPIPASTSLILASPPPDRRSRFSSGRSTSGEGILRKPLVVSWSNGSKKDRSLSRSAVDKPERQNSGNEFPILPSAGTVMTGGSNSKSCMPAPINRTPSYKASQQRQV